MLHSLNELRILGLSNTNLTGLRFGAHNLLSSVAWLDLSENQIAIVDQNSFANMPQLTTLIINNNYLRRLDNATFNSMINLRSLDLRFNEVDQIYPNFFASLPNLQEIKVEGNWCINNNITHTNATFTNRFQTCFNRFNGAPALFSTTNIFVMLAFILGAQKFFG